jgi:AmmeMemoRadiSam system protein B
MSRPVSRMNAGYALCYNAVAVSEKLVPRNVRPSPIAGTWYPGDSRRLAESIDRFLENAAGTAPVEGEIVGLIVPHAGHRYSGQVAAYAFALIRELQPDIVAILSPLHALAPGQVLTSGHSAYATPLGEISIDHERQASFERQLRLVDQIDVQQIVRDQEHALEIELPFLQRALRSEFRLLPLMLRDQSKRVVRAVGEALASVLERGRSLIVASSDLSHFYPQEIAQKLDHEMLHRIESFQPEQVLDAETEGVGFACGRGAVAAALWAARGLGADRVRLLQHATSGDVTGDMTSVVGYGSAVIYRTSNPGTGPV